MNQNLKGAGTINATYKLGQSSGPVVVTSIGFLNLHMAGFIFRPDNKDRVVFIKWDEGKQPTVGEQYILPDPSGQPYGLTVTVDMQPPEQGTIKFSYVTTKHIRGEFNVKVPLRDGSGATLEITCESFHIYELNK